MEGRSWRHLKLTPLWWDSVGGIREKIYPLGRTALTAVETNTLVAERHRRHSRKNKYPWALRRLWQLWGTALVVFKKKNIYSCGGMALAAVEINTLWPDDVGGIRGKHIPLGWRSIGGS